MRRLFMILILILLPLQVAAGRAPNLILSGRMVGGDHQTYREIPFRVPPGVDQITLEFTYSGHDQKSTIDLGVRDPHRFRGWSGGNKDRVVIGEAWASASYLAGPLLFGQWFLVLGIPNIRSGAVADYAAKIWFDRADDRDDGFQQGVLKPELAWYRGDLHMHTAHSDGSCPSRQGARKPCPVYKTLEAARSKGLDFIAVTDHNTTSQNAEIARLAPSFDDLLLIPGRELTTFQGHANLFGPVGELDFRVSGPRRRTINDLLRQVRSSRGIISINHPALPSGETCMGCGWTAKSADYSLIQAVEVVNGGTLAFPGAPQNAFSGLPFWEARLDAGHRITGIGGSDNHDATLAPDKPSAIGLPTTVVHAQGLSQSAIMSAIAKGHVFVDVWGTRERLLEVTARTAQAQAEMGDILYARDGEGIDVSVRVQGAPAGSRVALVGFVHPIGDFDASLAGTGELKVFKLTADGRAHWFRVDVRDSQDRLILIGNPIYLRPSPQTRLN